MRSRGLAARLALFFIVIASLGGCASGGDGEPPVPSADGAALDDASADARDGSTLPGDASVGDAPEASDGALDSPVGQEAAPPADAAPEQGPPEDGPGGDGGCTADDQCPLGKTCNGTGDCVPGCDPGHGCPSGQSCCGTTCIPSGKCCSATDCEMPPAPTSCYPAEGVCSGVGGTCSYTANSGSFICNSSTCCNSIHGTCNSNCTLDCEGGWGHCTGDPSKGCETDTNTDTSDCGECGRACSSSSVRGLSCAGGVCDSTCVAGWGNCSKPAAPAPDDGCESDLKTCVGTPCCATGVCVGEHHNGFGDEYADCALFGVPGNASTYTESMADKARKAWTTTGKLSAGTCLESDGVTKDSCLATEASTSAVWCYTGELAGYAHGSTKGVFCPTTGSQAWD